MQGFEGSLGEDVEGLVEGGGAEAGFEAGYSEEIVLGQGDAFEGEEFLRVLRLVDGDEVFAEAVDGFSVFDFDDGEVDAGEGMFAGVPRRSGFALGGARAGGVLSVGSVGGELFVGDGHLELRVAREFTLRGRRFGK